MSGVGNVNFLYKGDIFSFRFFLELTSTTSIDARSPLAGVSPGRPISTPVFVLPLAIRFRYQSLLRSTLRF